MARKKQKKVFGLLQATKRKIQLRRISVIGKQSGVTRVRKGKRFGVFSTTKKGMRGRQIGFISSEAGVTTVKQASRVAVRRFPKQKIILTAPVEFRRSKRRK